MIARRINIIYVYVLLKTYFVLVGCDHGLLKL